MIIFIIMPIQVTGYYILLTPYKVIDDIKQFWPGSVTLLSEWETWTR